eukprot:806847-Rhodomonas_salina.1
MATTASSLGSLRATVRGLTILACVLGVRGFALPTMLCVKQVNCDGTTGRTGFAPSSLPKVPYGNRANSQGKTVRSNLWNSGSTLRCNTETELSWSTVQEEINRFIVVHDDVFSPEACAILDKETSLTGLGHKVFRRESVLQGKSTLLEQALNSYLDTVGDESPVCEYWCRKEWKNIDAHIDADEFLYREKGKLRYPFTGHVLYLDVGSSVAGPTCLWHQTADNVYDSMVAVPAVAGRVLRFGGDLLHAVPRPTLRFLSGSMAGLSSKGPDFRRSVVLFNTWNEAPANVPESENESGNDGGTSCLCNPKSSWRARKCEQAGVQEEETKLTVWLLGDRGR